MKRYLVKILMFVILFILTNILYLLTIQKVDLNFSKAIEIKNFENQDLKVIVLGNSLTLDGIDTEFFTNRDVKSYNFALAGSTLKSNFIQLSYYLENNSKPETVLLGLGSSLKNYKNLSSFEGVHPVIDYCYRDKIFMLDNLPMIKFKWLATENLKKLVSKQHRESKLVLGQLRIKRKVPDNTSYRKKLKSKMLYKDYKGAKYLFKIDSLCKTNDIELMVIEMPGYKKTQNDIPIGPNTIIYSNDSLMIYNLNNRKLCDNLFEDKIDWLGNSHLNENGARKLTEYIFENILKKNEETQNGKS